MSELEWQEVKLRVVGQAAAVPGHWRHEGVTARVTVMPGKSTQALFDAERRTHPYAEKFQNFRHCAGFHFRSYSMPSETNKKSEREVARILSTILPPPISRTPKFLRISLSRLLAYLASLLFPNVWSHALTLHETGLYGPIDPSPLLGRHILINLLLAE